MSQRKDIWDRCAEAIAKHLDIDGYVDDIALIIYRYFPESKLKPKKSKKAKEKP